MPINLFSHKILTSTSVKAIDNTSDSLSPDSRIIFKFINNISSAFSVHVDSGSEEFSQKYFARRKHLGNL